MDEQLTAAADMAAHRQPAFPGESADYAKARQDLLAAEIEFRRHMTRLTAQRQALPPGPLITKDYRFKDEQGFEVGPGRPVRRQGRAGQLLLDVWAGT